MEAIQDYLDPQTLASIGPLELRARLIVEGHMTGMHRSPYQGFSVEFAQHRAYAPGDDIRHLDWKVFGRTDKLYIKQYQKETNLDLVLLIDTSSSMAYASRSIANWRKFDHAASIAAALAYLALHQQDRVGVVLFDEKITHQLRGSNAKGHWRAIVESLSAQPVATMAQSRSAAPPEPRRTDLGRLFDQVGAKLTQRSLVVLISDLFDDPESLEQGLARLRHRRHDVVLLQVLDDAELNFPFRDPSEFVGMEGEGRLILDPAALRREYLAALQVHLRAVEQVARRFHYDHMLMNSHESVGGPLSFLLTKRTAAVARGVK